MIRIMTAPVRNRKREDWLISTVREFSHERCQFDWIRGRAPGILER